MRVLKLERTRRYILTTSSTSLTTAPQPPSCRTCVMRTHHREGSDGAPASWLSLFVLRASGSSSAVPAPSPQFKLRLISTLPATRAFQSPHDSQASSASRRQFSQNMPRFGFSGLVLSARWPAGGEG